MYKVDFDECIANFYRSGDLVFPLARRYPNSMFACPFGVRSVFVTKACLHCKDFRDPPIQVHDEIINCIRSWIFNNELWQANRDPTNLRHIGD